MNFRSFTTLVSALVVFVVTSTAGWAGVVSKSKWERDFQFGKSDTLEVQIFRLTQDGNAERILDETYTLTGSGYATVDGNRVKIGGLNMFSALASLESAFRRDSFSIGLETKGQISKRNGSEIVFVDGEVKRPGIVTIKDDATLEDLIEAAGGVKESATLERVSVTHNGITTLVDVTKAADTKVLPGAVIKVSRALMREGGKFGRELEGLGVEDDGEGKFSVDRLKGE